jgi:hypothetical protein
MLKPETIKREMRRLQKMADSRALLEEEQREALHMLNALRWVLGGCTWRPSGIVT